MDSCFGQSISNHTYDWYPVVCMSEWMDKKRRWERGNIPGVPCIAAFAPVKVRSPPLWLWGRYYFELGKLNSHWTYSFKCDAERAAEITDEWTLWAIIKSTFSTKFSESKLPPAHPPATFIIASNFWSERTFLSSAERWSFVTAADFPGSNKILSDASWLALKSTLMTFYRRALEWTWHLIYPFVRLDYPAGLTELGDNDPA